MKELSIEEKAKAYDEALEKAKEQAKKYGLDRVVVESIFPELNEPENEKIRKEMIFYFTEEIPQCSIQEHSDKMREFISWLKRQEVECTKLELKAGNSYFCYKSRWERADSETFKKGLIYKCNKDGVLDNFVIKNPEQHFIEIKDERIAWLEKQGEPTEINPSEFDSQLNRLLKQFESLPKEELASSLSFYLNVVQNDGTYKSDEKQGEYKPTWSEEDERRLKSCLNILQPKTFVGNTETINTKWLKTLKDRVQQQPKQEWSENDERIRKISIGLLEVLGYQGYATRESVDWLKSLRPQTTWKPSVEHYELEEFAKIVRGNLTGISKAVQKLFEAKYLQLTGNKMYRGFKD